MEETPSGGNTTGTTDSAPATFEQAFAASAPAASPAAEPASPDTTPPAAAQPGQDSAASPQQPDDRSPYIPRTRFDEVNTERATLKQWKEQYAWAERPDVQQIVQMIANAKGDPMAFFAQQFADLAQHPTYSAQLRTFLGQQFGSLRQRPADAAPAMPEPDVAIFNDQGQEIGRTFSDKALAQRDAFLKQQVLQEVTQSIAPEMQTLKTITAERHRQAQDAQANTFASSLVSEFQSIPGFDPKVHGPKLAEEIGKLQLAPDAHPAEVEAAARKALLTVVLPTLNQKSQSDLLDSLKKQAAASTAANPASTGGGSRANVTSFHDKSLVW